MDRDPTWLSVVVPIIAAAQGVILFLVSTIIRPILTLMTHLTRLTDRQDDHERRLGKIEDRCDETHRNE